MTHPTIPVTAWWGKTGERYHPAVYHMLDVGMIAAALLSAPPARLRHVLATTWGTEGRDEQLRWLPYFIALHDIGKISATFQLQSRRAATNRQRERLLALGVAAGSSVAVPHNAVGAWWVSACCSLPQDMAQETRWAWRDAVDAHHGRFSRMECRDIEDRVKRSEGRILDWTRWRHDADCWLRQALGIDQSIGALGKPTFLRPATAVLTGLMVWCDWIGSNSMDFPAAEDVAPEEYPALSRDRAHAALLRHHLIPMSVNMSSSSISYRALIGAEPRPLQQRIAELPDDVFRRDGLIVIEAPTGEGKTEAALIAIQQRAMYTGIHEFFCGLPTISTGNQMFERVNQCLRRVNIPIAAKLTHSQAFLIESTLLNTIFAEDSDIYEDIDESAKNAIEWYVGSKKALLAPYGVGTVDQIELSGLNVRHYALRLLGLAGKCVIIDEIHAYDAYMNTILDHVLSWLKCLGCTVILLSATLPIKRHRELVKAWNNGNSSSYIPDNIPYPAISIHQSETRIVSCETYRTVQNLHVSTRLLDNAHNEAQYMLELIKHGGAIARICNRIDDAQKIAQSIRELDSQVVIILVHARIPFYERRSREILVDTYLGPKSTRMPSDRIILVGTQVLEQSLDYDVDYMISDIAPIDLLLQRAGRIFRHNRSNRSLIRQVATLEVVVSVNTDNTLDATRWQKIYSTYILKRTWQILPNINEFSQISLPVDYRTLIEYVYSEDKLNDPFIDEITAQKQHNRQISHQQALARNPLIPMPVSLDALSESSVHAFCSDEDLAHGQIAQTRLGKRVTILPVYQIDHVLTLDRQHNVRIDHLFIDDAKNQQILIEHSLPLSNSQIVDEICNKTMLWPQKTLPISLKTIYPLLFDSSGHAIVKGFKLTLDDFLGLVITKLHGIDEEESGE
jgi:CRISPR-associated endonuclease/helicase Cas3